MNKHLKIFLWSLVGSIVGVVAFGAISNIGRDGEKKDEETKVEVTLQTFQDPTKYTEVAAQVGDKVAGNWYRIYANSIFSWDNMETTTGTWLCLDSEGGLAVHYGSNCQIPVETYCCYTETEIGGYVDLYLPVGDYIFVTGEDNTEDNKNNYPISESSTISSVSGTVYQLIPNV